MLAALDSADQCFVNFNRSAGTTKGALSVNRRHMLADERGRAPRRFIGHPKLALEFLAADAVARRREQVNGIEPKLERSAGLLEGRPDRGVKVVAAPLAGIGPLSLDAKPLRRALA